MKFLGLFIILLSFSSVSFAGKRKTTPVIKSIAINATAQQVWDVIMDFESYGVWNEWVVRLDGKNTKGSKLRAYDDQGRSLKLKITKIDPPNEICWVDISWFTKFGMGGWRCRSIAPNPDGEGVIFTNHFEYTGPFRRFLEKRTRDILIKGMELENQNLKDYLAP